MEAQRWPHSGGPRPSSQAWPAALPHPGILPPFPEFWPVSLEAVVRAQSGLSGFSDPKAQALSLKSLHEFQPEEGIGGLARVFGVVGSVASGVGLTEFELRLHC